jgi:site-specific recombinase XerD
MTGSNNSQLIIPHQTKDLKFTVPETTVIPENTPVIENHENTHEIWIPESTRILLNKVIQELSLYVPQDQLGDIAIILSQIFNNIDCVKVKKKGDSKKRVEYIVREYLDAMTIEGKSHNTLNYYRQTIIAFFKYYPDKHVEDITTQDIRTYLFNRTQYAPQEDPHIIEHKLQEHFKNFHKFTKRTADNNRRILNTFFKWLVAERIILFNPLDPIKKIKYKETIKKPYTTEEIMKLRDGCITPRDRAIVEFLLSTGCRVGECCSIRLEDIDWQNREIIVTGKGDKDRYVYLNDVTIHYLKEYLNSRQDGVPWLWVHENPNRGTIRKLGKTGIEQAVRTIGERVGIKGAHPHKFRHTFATNALNKGISLEQVQQMMGHANADTTLIYAKVAHEDVRHAHKKYMNM